MAAGFLNAGFVAAGLGGHELAVRLYSRAISLLGADNPAAVVAFVRRAASLSRLGRHDEALKDKEWVMRALPHTAHADTSYQLAAQPEVPSQTMANARRAEEARDFDRATELYSRVLADESLSHEGRRKALRGRAFSFERIKRFSEAEQDLSALAAIAPSDADLHVRRGHFYLERGRFEDAYAVFEEGGRLRPTERVFFVTARGGCIPRARSSRLPLRSTARRCGLHRG